MTSEEFDVWHRRAVESYAADIARATGMAIEGARDRVRGQDAQMLPDGRSTADTWLMTICDDSGAAVGTLWIGRQPERDDSAFIYDIEVHESRRGEGLGRAAMIAAEELVKAAGFQKIGLSVFGFNERAQRLYTSLDYRVVATQMTKHLE
jgi:ribosomal protein S18 acetylase RimI-like enzyme